MPRNFFLVDLSQRIVETVQSLGLYEKTEALSHTLMSNHLVWGQIKVYAVIKPERYKRFLYFDKQSVLFQQKRIC